MTRKIIEDWILETVRTKGYERLAELHIDEISSEYRQKENWIKGAVWSFSQAVDILESRALRFKVTMDICLKTEDDAIGVNFTTPEELATQLSYQPPSLHLLALNQLSDMDRSIELPLGTLECNVFGAQCRYLETQDESGEFARFVWLEKRVEH